METKLVNYEGILAAQNDKLGHVLKNYLDIPQVADSFATIKAIYNGKLRSLEPQIMVYGIYNAGKSSIINALLRAQKAKVADRPMTDSVDYYTWNGYKLADTPGVGAPIAHEEVTQEHLKKADVVLFVMSTSGSFEYEQNYSRMKDIIVSGKKVLIILNDKQGYLGDDSEKVQSDLMAIKSKIVKNMNKIGIDEKISNMQDKYKIIIVNADDAKTALEYNDKELWENSNIDELEKYINIELKNASSIVVLRNGINVIELELEKIVSSMQDTENKAEIKEINDMLGVIREQKTNIRQEMKNYIDNKTTRIGKNLPNMIWMQRENEVAINQLVEGEVNKVINAVQDKLVQEFVAANDVLAIETENLVEKLERFRVEVNTKVNVNHSFESGSLDKEDNGNSEASASGSNIQFKELLEAVNAINQLYKGKVPNMDIPIVYNKQDVTENIRDMVSMVGAGEELLKTFAPNVVKSMTKMLPSVFGKVGVAGTIGKFLPYVGPILTVVSVVQALFSDDANDRVREQISQQNAAEQRRLEAEEQARHALQQNCEMLAEDLKESLLENVNASINKGLGSFESIFTKQLSSSKNVSNTLSSDLTVIRNIQNELNCIRMDISA